MYFKIYYSIFTIFFIGFAASEENFDEHYEETAGSPGRHSRSASICKEGSVWMKDCNQCICTNGIVACTQKLCLVTRPGTNNFNVAELHRPAECVSSSTTETAKWRKECNWCRCINGRGACTKKGCFAGIELNLPECEGDARWKEDCNWCRCSSNGTAICTKNECSVKPIIDFDVTSCVENTFWQDGCSACKCTNKKIVCSVLDNCIEEAENKENTDIQTEKSDRNAKNTLPDQCFDGSRWRDNNCNWCNCISGNGVCTERACFPGRPDPLAGKCGNNSWWRDGCKWCHCEDENIVCSNNTCDANYVMDRGETCLHGSRWREACNWCNCFKGKAACTRMICAPGKPDPYAGQCTDGSWWKQGCQWCHCSDGKIVCSKDLCIKPINEPVCTAGSRWRQQCNWCNCIEGRAACTRKLCLAGRVDPYEGHCDNGSEWKDDCNLCRCYAERAICTRKDCSKTNITEAAVIDPRNAECLEGSFWMKDSDHYYCHDGKAVCNNKNGPSCVGYSSETITTCTANSFWREDCNWCHCSDGVGVCSAKICNIEPPGKMPQCLEGTTWTHNCNECKCLNGVGVCTLRACLHTTTDGSKPIPQCLNGTTWNYDCNTCRCAGLIPVCTRASCSLIVSEPENAYLATNKCLGDSEWREGCDWCKCRKGQVFCERGNQCDLATVTEECKGDSHWSEDCNWCRCVSGRSICSTKTCSGVKVDLQIDNHPSGVGKIPEPLALDLESTFILCAINPAWSNGCNTCFCERNSYVCTLRKCIRAGSVPPKIHEIITTSRLPYSDDSDDDLPSNLPPLCALPPTTDSCSKCLERLPMWTYNRFTSTCEEIIYSGCGGTDNLFKSRSDCVTICQPIIDISLFVVSTLRQPRSEACFMERDHGGCSLSLKRYGFNPKNNRCEAFLYGGCQGNENNFLTAEACFKACGGDSPVHDGLCDRAQCDWIKLKHYFAKRCTPQYHGLSCCPTSFICKTEEELNMSLTKCYYHNKEYNELESLTTRNPCDGPCKCARSPSDPTRSEFNCPNIECPSLFNPPLDPGCRRIYSSDKCCEVAVDCDYNATSPYADLRSITCSWEGKTYRGGDKMYFSGKDVCQKCICSQNFTDPYGPGCINLDCGFQLRKRVKLFKGCVPVYFENRCCPFDWICPTDKRIGSFDLTWKITTNTKSPLHCKLGEQVIPIGSKANITDCRMECTCRVPPDVTCVRADNCGKSLPVLAKELELNCSSGCYEVFDSATNSYFCSCNDYVANCSYPECPSQCNNPMIVVDKSAGCQKCTCDCPQEPVCPKDCETELYENRDTGCIECRCLGKSLRVHFDIPICPHGNNPPCPMDCAIIKTTNKNTGCLECKCSGDGVNPFVSQPICPHGNNPPCPMDCGIIKTTNKNTGCLECKCSGDGVNPFVSQPICPHGNSPPCPMDCAIEKIVNKDTGCLECKCSGEGGNPFTSQPFCPYGDNPPCPMDCAIEKIHNKVTGCLECRCSGAYFDPFNPSVCPYGNDPPCPMDCAIEKIRDPSNGCLKCVCRTSAPTWLG